MADETHGEIEINADPATVMDVIADLETYHEWADGVNGIEVLTATDTGRPDTALFDFSSGPIKDKFTLQYDWTHEDTEWFVTWSLIEGQVLKKEEGKYTVVGLDNGKTRVLYNLMVDLSIPLPGMIKRKAEKKMVETALKGLKKRVESL